MHRHHTRRALTAVATATAAAFLIAGCGGNAAQNADTGFDAETADTTMTVWGFANTDEVGTSRFEYAEGVLDGVTVETDATNFDAQKFTTLAASGDLPDLVQMDRNYVASYAANGLILPLDNCYAQNEVDPAERFYEPVAADLTWDDQVWGVAQFFQPPAILLNTRVLDEAGLTADDFDTSDGDRLLDVASQLTVEDGGLPTRLGFDPRVPGQVSLWLLAFGGQLMDDDGAPTLDAPENAEALAYLQQLFDAQGGYEEAFSFIGTFDSFGEENQFVQDQVAAQLLEQWNLNVLANTADDITIEAVPFRGQDGEAITTAGGQAFVIPATAENPTAACEFALALTELDAWLAAGEARADRIAAEGGIFTGLFTGSPEADQTIREQFVTETGNAGFDQAIDTYYDVAETGASIGTSAAGQEIQAALAEAVTAVMLGEATAEEGLADAQSTAQRAYEQALED